MATTPACEYGRGQHGLQEWVPCVSRQRCLSTLPDKRGVRARVELGWLPVSAHPQCGSRPTTGGGMPGHRRGPDALSPQGGLCLENFYSPCHPEELCSTGTIWSGSSFCSSDSVCVGGMIRTLRVSEYTLGQKPTRVHSPALPQSSGLEQRLVRERKGHLLLTLGLILKGGDRPIQDFVPLGQKSREELFTS